MYFQLEDVTKPRPEGHTNELKLDADTQTVQE